jgi:hypothetical protein
VPNILDLTKTKRTLTPATLQLLTAEDLQDQPNMTKMIGLGSRDVNKNIIQVDLDEIVNELPKDVSHHPLKSTRRVY